MSEPPRALRHLIALYPRRHREPYGAEMWEVVRHRYAVSRGTGRVGLHVATAWDLLWNAAAAWAGPLSARSRRARSRRARRGSAGPGRRPRAGGGWRGVELDLRWLARSLARSPAYTVTVVLVLGGAVAVNATVYGFVRGTLLSEPAFGDADRVVLVWGSAVANGQLRDVVSGPDFVDLAREATTVAPLAAYHYSEAYLDVEGRPEVVEALEISADFLEALDVAPMLGRDFGEEDRASGGPDGVLVSHAFWQDRLGADPAAVGRAVEIEGRPRTVLGVLPAGFAFLAPAQLYLPLREDLMASEGRRSVHYNLVGRLAPGRTAADATRELTAILVRNAREHGGLEGWTVLAEPLGRASTAAVRPVIGALTATVGLVLVLALVNLATLFRIRTLARSGEIALRLALGAGRARVVRVLALETGALALAGSALGLALAPLLLERVTALVPLWIAIPGSALRVPVLRGLLDPAVVATTAALAVLGALVLTAPAALTALRSASPGSGDRSLRGGRATRALVGVELALATVLCLAAGLTTRSTAALLATDPGIEDTGLLALWVGDVWGLDAPDRVAYFRRVVEAVEAVPGVRSAAVTDYVDFQAEDDFQGVSFLDRALEPVVHVREEWRRVSEGLFETAGMRVLSGRGFTRGDFQGTPRVAVVNQAFARKHAPDGDLVGRPVSVHEDGYRQLEIVGVVADLRSLGPGEPAPPVLYVPNQGAPRGTQGLYVRVAGDPTGLAPSVHEAIWSVDPSQPIAGTVPMTEVVGAWVAIPRATRALLAGLAVISLVLAAAGVFGVVAYAVGSRRGELGVRLALGASPRRLEREVVGSVVPVAVVGIGVGLAAGVVGAGAARALLYGVRPGDPLTVAATVAAMAGAALLASWLPARRVASIHPASALKAE